MVLPDLVRYEQIPSLLHFFYTGDYSVDEADMAYYSVPPCPDGCVTCPQICQLLRVHLAMFQTALLLRITDLQALAFRRFRDLMDTAPIDVLRFAVHAAYSRRPIPDGEESFRITGLKGITDYRPELVLPAILRYCGYYRLNPAQVRRKWKVPKELGEGEFADLRRQCPKFDVHLTRGLWLDMIDITVPTIQFPGQSEPIRSLHPYMHTPLPPRPVDSQRSNYQYVTYLQPLPFKAFSEQELAGPATPTWASLSGSSPSAPLEPREPLQQITEAIDLTTEPVSTTEQPQDSSFDDRSLFGTPDETAEPLPETDDTAPVDANQVDWTQTMDWSGADLPDIDFTQLFGDSTDPTVPFDWLQPSDTTEGDPALLSNGSLGLADGTSSYWPQPTSSELDLDNLDFTQLLNGNSSGLPDGTSFDWTNSTDVGHADMDFTQFLNDDSFLTADTLGVSDGISFDCSVPATSNYGDLANMDPAQLLTDDALDMLFTDSSCLELPVDMDLDLSNQTSGDTAVLPDLDFTGLQPQGSSEFQPMPKPEPMDLSFLPATGASSFAQEIDFLPPTHLTHHQASATPQCSLNPRGSTQSAVSSATPAAKLVVSSPFGKIPTGASLQRRGSARARRDSRIRRSTVTSTRQGSSISSYCTSAPATSSRYNLRNRGSKKQTVDLED
jgi:hypothetical protein